MSQRTPDLYAGILDWQFPFYSFCLPFYGFLLNDYFDCRRTIVVTTHQVEEIQNVLTDVMFINRGRIVSAQFWATSENQSLFCNALTFLVR